MKRVSLGILVAASFVCASAPLQARRARPVVVDARAQLVKELQGKLERITAQLAQLGSYLDQVKDLSVRVIRMAQVVKQLERAAQAPKELDRKIEGVARQLAALEQQVEGLRMHRVRRADQARRGAKGIRAGYDDGFYIASPGDKYRLVVGGVLRTTFRVGEVTKNSHLEPDSKVDLLSANVPTAMLIFSGNVFTRKLTYYVELEFGGGGVALNDFFVNLRTCPYFGVSVGQLPTGFTRQYGRDPYDTIFVDGSPAMLMFAPGRDIGVKLHFYQWKERVFQELSVFNGGGVNAGGNDNVDLLYMARVGIAPLGPVPNAEGDLRRGARPLRFQLAAGYFFNPMPSGEDLDAKDGMDNIFVHQVAAELTAVWAGFSLNGELFYRHADHGEAVRQLVPPEKRRRNNLGGFAQLSYTFRCIWLMLAARYSYTEPVSFWRRADNALVFGWTSPLDGATGLPSKVHEVTAGVNFYGFSQHLKLMANYTFLLERGYLVEGVTGKQNRQVHLASLLLQARF